MKRKILSMILCSVMLSSTVCSCGVDVVSDSQYDTISETIDTTEEITESTEEVTTEPVTKSESDFDFVKTIESTYICGHQLSYPPTWGQLGEDFSIPPEEFTTSPGSGQISCSVYYKGQYLGAFIFNGCETVEAITNDTEIVQFLIQNDNMEKFDVSKISVNGVELKDTHEILYESLGSDYEIGVDESQINYCDDDGRFHFGFGKFKDNGDKLGSIIITFII